MVSVNDVLILGGGIVGAGIARDASLRGLRVVLIDKHTIGWGTSSRSSRLIHGGIRYLEMGDIALVREALHERATLLRIAPHLVHPLPFLFVLDRGQRWQWLRVSVGVVLYKLLAGRRALGPHHPLSRTQLLQREPLLRGAPLLGGAIYQDARGDDLGLVRSNIASARASGARIFESVDAHIVIGAESVRATLPTGEVIDAQTMVLALGPWTDQVRHSIGLPDRDMVGGTKGVHLEFSLSRLPLTYAVALRHPEDGRVMFCVPEPERGRVLVGTTDTETTESPDALTIDPADTRYLLRAVQHLFPTLALSAADIVDQWVGVRPLVQQQGAASTRSREHIMLREGQILTIAGGKLTTYRAMAEKAVDLIGDMLGRPLSPCQTGILPLP